MLEKAELGGIILCHGQLNPVISIFHSTTRAITHYTLVLVGEEASIQPAVIKICNQPRPTPNASKNK